MAIDTTNGVPTTSLVTKETDLNAPVTFSYDKVFENLVDNIVPKAISSEHKTLIDSFVDILAEMSPISVNIADVFHKENLGADVHNNHIKGVQDGFSQMYLENFWSVVEKAKDDYTLQNRLANIIAKYQGLGEDVGLESNLKFFGNTDELFNQSRYILGKDFKEKKGTATAIEYAYKLGWLAEIEGPLRDSYHFELLTPECEGGIAQGIRIACENPWTASPEAPSPDANGDVFPDDDPCTGIPLDGEKFINEFYISPALDESDCTPFSYSVEGSMVPALFQAFVMPLAHPVGFSYIYTKVLSMEMEDFFNIEYIYRADKVSVKSLCPDGDCSRSSEDVYATATGADSISNSSLKYFDSGDLYAGIFSGWSYEKYIFENGSYLISYKQTSARGAVEEIVHYYDIADILAVENLIKNGAFTDGTTDWTFGANWSVVDGIAVNSGGALSDIISQDIILKDGATYNISLNSSLSTNNDNFIINLGGTVINILTSGISNHQVTIGAIHTDLLSVYGDGKTFSVDDISVTEIIPTTIYDNFTHSSVVTDNPSFPIAVLYTHDKFQFDSELNVGGYVDVDLGCENVVVNHRFNIDGDTIIENGEFRDPIGTYWSTIGTAWSQVDDAMVFTDGTLADELIQPVQWEVGKNYEIIGRSENVSYNDYLVITLDGEVFELNNHGDFSVFYTPTINDIDITVSAKNDIDGVANLTLTRIQVREIGDIGLFGWNAGSNWEVIDGRATNTEGILTEPLLQRFDMVSGDTYRVEFDGEFDSSLDRAFVSLDGAEFKFGGKDRKRFEYTPSFTGLHTLRFYSDGATFWIDNIVIDCNKTIIGDKLTSLYTNTLAIIGDLVIAQTALGSDITQEGGFIIGGIVLPHGDISTQYMFDDLSISVEGQTWTQAISPIDFQEPSNWFTDIGWNIITDDNPLNNYAECDGTQIGMAKLTQEFEVDDELHTEDHFLTVNFSIENANGGFIRVETGIDNGIIDFYESGNHTFIMMYDHALEGTGTPNTVQFLASYVTSTTSTFEGRINNVEVSYL